MRKSKLTETVLRALRPSVNEKEEEIEAEEEVEDIEGDEEIKVKDVEKISIKEPEGTIDAGRFVDVQNALISALDAAKDIGDEKLVTQIGNTITFVTRSQVRGAEASVDEVKTSKYTSLAEKVIARIKESKKKASLKEDWDNCIDKVIDQGKSQKSAEKICGAINRDYVGNYE